MNTVQKGDLTVSKVIAAILSRGDSVAMPFGDGRRYDIIWEHGSSLFRVQCKTASYQKNGSLLFRTCNNDWKGKERPYSKDQIDYFAIYSVYNDKVYMIPIQEIVCRRMGSLRLTPAKSGRKKDIRYAEDYEF